ncbi:MAG: aminotransferase class I/II-fold pyridoxal phosphate-dependent enzyme [Blastocatellia bacterium]|nr:aminotransferase class I/II-fold pyridoxal phosphate-dependent enzyme [Blastocatellia bacterium]
MKRQLDRPDLGGGGKIWEVAREWGVSPRTILDFSSSLNPLGPSLRVMVAFSQAAVAYQPDDHDCREALAQWCKVPIEQIFIGTGTSSLLFAAVRALKPRSAVMFEPAFSEYSRALKSVEVPTKTIRVTEKQGFLPDFEKLRRDLKKDRTGVLILNSPHNPTGVAYPRKELLETIRVAKRADTNVVLDESFIDYLPEESLVSEVSRERNLIVLRSLTPFFSIAGLRIGYAVAAPSVLKSLQAQLDRWPVATPALAAAAEAVQDHIFVRRTLAYNLEARAEFEAELTRLGCSVVPGVANFLLVKLPLGSAHDLAAWLAPHHVLIRTGDTFLGLGDRYLRLGVRSREQNRKFISLLEQWLADRQAAPLPEKAKEVVAVVKKAVAPRKAKPKTTPSKKRLKKVSQ